MRLRFFFIPVFLFAATVLFAESLPDPETLLQTVQTEENTFSSWFRQQKEELLAAFLKTLLTVVICVLLLYLRRKYRESVRLADILVQPLLLFVTLALCFHFIHPVIQSLPGNSATTLEMKVFYAGTALIITWGLLGLITLLNRQIRRMCEKTGLHIKRLTRVAIGKITLGELPLGRYRALREDEVAYLKGEKEL